MMEEKIITKRTDTDWDAHTDVIVIGSGFAGLSAAIHAKLCGASVIIFEKMLSPGGNSVISDGGIAAPETDIQKDGGIQDSPELMYQDMMKSGLGRNHSSLVKVVAEKAKEAFDWSKEFLGVEYLNRIDIFGGHSVPRCYTAKGRTGKTIIQALLNKVKELNIELRLGWYISDLMQDKDGSVVGIEAFPGYKYNNPITENKILFNAKRGVVIASGGYGADVSFRILQDPRLDVRVDTTNKISSTAEVIKAALRIGAAPIQLSFIQLGPWASPDEKGFGVGPGFADYILFQYGIIVDPSVGSRFCDEMADRRTVAEKMMDIGHPCVGFVDSHAVQIGGWNIDRAIKNKVVRVFESLQDLALFYSIPCKNLETTVARFNESFVLGADEEYHKPLLPGAEPLRQAPYYAIRLFPKVHYTMGGLGINTEAQVIDLSGRPIKGLFAAGEVTGGVHGASRLGSCSITECLVFGKIAGRKVAGIEV